MSQTPPEVAGIPGRARVRLIHWNAAGAARYIDLLADAGYQVEYSHSFQPASMRAWRESPPDAFVFDLSRLPSHCREIAISLRQSKATRAVPMIFCEGLPGKIEQTRSLLPDAAYCRFTQLNDVLRTALESGPKLPVIPVAMMNRYAGRTTAQKLGIKLANRVRLIDAPRDVHKVLGELPDGVEFVEGGAAEVTVCFATDPAELQDRLSELRAVAGRTKLWICWKKGKGTAGGVSERLVRECGIALGLVDYKVCSVNDTWSGLLFSRRDRRSNHSILPLN